jgi:hypothetical protein
MPLTVSAFLRLLHVRPVLAGPSALPTPESAVDGISAPATAEIRRALGPGGRSMVYRSTVYRSASIEVFQKLEPTFLVSYGHHFETGFVQKNPGMSQSQRAAIKEFKPLLEQAKHLIQDMLTKEDMSTASLQFSELFGRLHQSVQKMKEFNAEPIPAVKTWLMDCAGIIPETIGRRQGAALLIYQQTKCRHALLHGKFVSEPDDEARYGEEKFQELIPQVQIELDQIFELASKAPLCLANEPCHLLNSMPGTVRLPIDTFTHVQCTSPDATTTVLQPYINRARALQIALAYTDSICGRPGYHATLANAVDVFLDSPSLVKLAFRSEGVEPAVRCALLQAAQYHGLADRDIPVGVLAKVETHTAQEYSQYFGQRFENSAQIYEDMELGAEDEKIRVLTVQLMAQIGLVGSASKERPKEAQFLDLMCRAYMLFTPFHTIYHGLEELLWSLIETDLKVGKTSIDLDIQRAVKESIFAAIAESQKPPIKQRHREVYQPEPHPPGLKDIFVVHRTFFIKHLGLNTGWKPRISLTDMLRKRAEDLESSRTLKQCVKETQAILESNPPKMQVQDWQDLYADLHMRLGRIDTTASSDYVDEEENEYEYIVNLNFKSKLSDCLDRIEAKVRELQAHEEFLQLQQAPPEQCAVLLQQLQEKKEGMLLALKSMPRHSDKGAKRVTLEGVISVSDRVYTRLVERLPSASTVEFIGEEHSRRISGVDALLATMNCVNIWLGQAHHNEHVVEACKMFKEFEGSPAHRGYRILSKPLQIFDAARYHGLAKCDIPLQLLHEPQLFGVKEKELYLDGRSAKSANLFLQYVGGDQDIAALIAQTKVSGVKSKNRHLDAHFLDLMDRVCTLAVRPYFQIVHEGNVTVDSIKVFAVIAGDLKATGTTINQNVMRAVRYFVDDGGLNKALAPYLEWQQQQAVAESRTEPGAAGVSTLSSPAFTARQGNRKLEEAIGQLQPLCMEVVVFNPGWANQCEGQRINAGKYVMASTHMRNALIHCSDQSITLDSAVEGGRLEIVEKETVQNALQKTQVNRTKILMSYIDKLFELFKGEEPQDYVSLLDKLSELLAEHENMSKFLDLVACEYPPIRRLAAEYFAKIPFIHEALAGLVDGSPDAVLIQKKIYAILERRAEFARDIEGQYADEEKERILRAQCGGYEPVIQEEEYIGCAERTWLRLNKRVEKRSHQTDAQKEEKLRGFRRQQNLAIVNFLIDLRTMPAGSVPNMAEIMADSLIEQERVVIEKEKLKTKERAREKQEAQRIAQAQLQRPTVEPRLN